MPPIPAMMLDALEQVALEARDHPVERSKPIAACLAYLYSLQPCERWPFYEFWKYLTVPDQKMRSANVQRCLNAICVQMGVDRQTKRPLPKSQPKR